MSKEEFDDISRKYINEYIESFMSYTEYLKVKDEYKVKYSPEFLYFGEAKIELEEDYLEYFGLL